MQAVRSSTLRVSLRIALPAERRVESERVWASAERVAESTISPGGTPLVSWFLNLAQLWSSLSVSVCLCVRVPVRVLVLKRGGKAARKRERKRCCYSFTCLQINKAIEIPQCIVTRQHLGKIVLRFRFFVHIGRVIARDHLEPSPTPNKNT